MKITKSQILNNKSSILLLSKKEWQSIGKITGWMKISQNNNNNNNNNSIIKRPDGNIVIITPDTINHIWKTHGPSAWGKGSIFSEMPNLKNAALNADFNNSQNSPFYPIPNASGYDLVWPTQEAQQMPNAKNTTTIKEENLGKNIMEDMNVPAISTTLPLSHFKTNEAYAIIVPANPQFLPPELKIPEILNKIINNQAYALISAFPGKKNVPKITQWNGQWTVVIPKK